MTVTTSKAAFKFPPNVFSLAQIEFNKIAENLKIFNLNKLTFVQLTAFAKKVYDLIKENEKQIAEFKDKNKTNKKINYDKKTTWPEEYSSLINKKNILSQVRIAVLYLGIVTGQRVFYL